MFQVPVLRDSLENRDWDDNTVKIVRVFRAVIVFIFDRKFAFYKLKLQSLERGELGGIERSPQRVGIAAPEGNRKQREMRIQRSDAASPYSETATKVIQRQNERIGDIHTHNLPLKRCNCLLAANEIVGGRVFAGGAKVASAMTELRNPPDVADI